LKRFIGHGLRRLLLARDHGIQLLQRNIVSCREKKIVSLRVSYIQWYFFLSFFCSPRTRSSDR